MKKIKIVIPLMLIITLAFGAWSNSLKVYKAYSMSMSGFRDAIFTPWDVEAASAYVDMQAKKPYTIMVYMNGSDLESDGGAATNDLIEMQDSGLSSMNANIIIFTGGTYRWHNNVVPSNDCVLWELADGGISEICGVGLVNMGDPGTLASFIDFSIKNYPAEKYGLIMWDHGGGSIAGYGHDEKFNYDNLSLLDMKYAFERAGLANERLEFLGFDSCLMATIEMAVVASDYADYLIASEDLEPGDGWDYGFLSILNHDPSISGAELGIGITDYFMRYYEHAADEILTMSVTDLSNVSRVMDAMGELMVLCSESLGMRRSESFATLAGKRGRTKTFGMGSPRDNECDMVDVGDMAAKLSDLYPYETAVILDELDKAVIYNRYNSDSELYGLSTYYIYGAKETGGMSLNTYSSLGVNGGYTQYLYNFYNMLRSGSPSISRYAGSSRTALEYADDVLTTELTIWQPIEGKPDGYRMIGIQSGINITGDEMAEDGLNAFWPKIGGMNVCLYRINSAEDFSLFAVPASLNGNDCDIIISISEEHPDGIIRGVRYEDGFIIQKGFDKIKEGDRISLYYRERDFGTGGTEFANTDTGWRAYGEFTAGNGLTLEWSELSGDELYYCLRLTDIRQNEDYTDLQILNK